MNDGKTFPVTSGQPRRSIRRAFLAQLALGWWLLLNALAVGSAATLTASLDRDTISLGESATLSLAFEGGAPKNLPDIPSVPNLTVTYGGQSSQLSIVNGQSSSTVILSFEVRVRQPGDYVIPQIRAVVDGKTLASQPLKVKVLKAGEAMSDTDGLAKFAFLKLLVPKETVFLGEKFPVELQLYVQAGQDLQTPQINADGFTLGKMVNTAQTRTQLGNAIYHVVTFKTSATAAKVGDLTLGPVQCSLNLQIAKARRRDIFDVFNDRVELRPVTLTSETNIIHVLPLPTENVPPSFNGAVGNYSIACSVSPTNVAVGDPILVRVQVMGRGAVEGLILPAQPAWREFKVYPATSRVELAPPLDLEGTNTLEQTVVPQNTEVKELPPFSFSFFDPDKKAYRTFTHPAAPLIVRPSAATVDPAFTAAVPAANDPPPPAQDIVHIKPRLGTLSSAQAPLARQSWFLLLQTIPALSWLTMLIWRKRSDALANNPRLRRQKQVARIVRTGLQELHRLAAAKQTEAFFSTLFRLLQEQLGERLDLPASSITEAIIDERLRSCKLGPVTLSVLHGLFQTCNQARYASARTSQELASLIGQLELILRELQNLQSEHRE